MISNCLYKTKCKGINCDKDFCERKYRLDCLYNLSLLSDIQRRPITLVLDADKTDREEFMYLASIEKQIETFVKEGHNLYLHSYTCGNGKSSWAVKLLQSYFNKIWHKSNFSCQGLFISVPRYLLELKARISGHSEYADFIDKYVLEADIVVWDDIAAKTGTEFELTRLLNLINSRMDAGKCNIFTSNLGRRELTAAVGERLASRISNLSYEVELHGADKRQLKLGGI